jgi:hypothetical protein
VKYLTRSLTNLTVLVLTVFGLSICASAQVSDSGSVALSGTSSSFVEIRAGGPATLSGNLSGTGGITNNNVKGQALGTLAIDLGELGNANVGTSFVKATAPLRLRSNANYTVSMGATAVSNADPDGIQGSDIGFGIDSVSRADPSVKAGTDTITAGMSGDPTADSDADLGTARWDYSTKKKLSFFSSSSAILSGTKIMNVTPSAGTDGLTLNSYFVVKPQYFAPGSFSSTVTFTITTP